MIKKYTGIFLFLLVFCFNGFASEYTWSSSVNKKEAFVYEAIYLQYVCSFNDKAELYTIDFHPEIENDFYTISLLSQKTKLVDNKKINTYEYIAFVKKPMIAEFHFKAIMEKTNKDSIENTVLGRDNADYEEFSSVIAQQDSIQVNIKEINTKISGNFSLEVKKDVQSVQAHQAFHLEVKIEGTGNFDALEEIDFALDGVKVFAQKPMKKTVLGIDGYKGSWSQKFAFVSAKDFNISKKSIEYYDIDSKSLKRLD